jgi:putative DNA primase/helicase
MVKMESDGSATVEEPRSADEAEPQQSVGEVAEEILTRLLGSLQNGGREDHRAAWVAIQDPDVMATLADGWRQSESNLSALISILETIPGQVQRSRTFRSAIRRLAEERSRRQAEEMIDRLEEELGQTQTLASQFGSGAPPPTVVEHGTLENLHVPRGYDIDLNGVYRLAASMDGSITRNKIAPAPIFIGGRTIDVYTGEAKRQVIWRGPSGWCSRVIERRTIMDASKIVTLTNLEAPINSNTSGQMVSYLSDFEAENSHRFPVVRSAARMGWQPDGGFLLPDVFYAASDEASSNFALTPPSGLETLSSGWTTAGSWEEWLEAMGLVSSFPYMYIATYAGAAAPLLSILKIPGFVVDFSGETSGGKTTALRFSASVWGRPAESYPTAMYSWDATKVWIERTSGFLNNLPLVLDETKRARHPRIVRDVIYDFCQGQGRGRGSVEGTRHTESWRSILISSGEGAATSFSEDAGTRARVLSLKGKPLGTDVSIGSRVSEEAQIILASNYGHLGRKIAQYLVANRERHDDIREIFKKAREKYANVARTAVARRHAGHLAVLEVAAAIVHLLGVPQPDSDPFAYLMESQERAGFDADRPLAALQDMLSWCATHQQRFWGRADTDFHGHAKPPSHGWAGSWGSGDDWEYIAISVITFKEIVRSIGHDPDEIIQRWTARGWLSTGNGRHRSRVVRVDGAPTRCYCIDREASDFALGG